MMFKGSAIILLAIVACSSAMPSGSVFERVKRSYATAPAVAAPVAPAYAPAPVAAVPGVIPAVAQVPAIAQVPTLTEVHSQRLIPQAPDVHTVAHPTTVLQTVQTGNAIVGHQKVADQVVGKTADVSGYAFQSEVRHDAPLYAPAPAVVATSVAVPVPIVAAPAPLVHPAPVLAAPLPLAHAPVVGAPLPLAQPAPVAVAGQPAY